MCKLVFRSDEARSLVSKAAAAGQKVGLVPTMGALHQGHLSLVKAARSECDFTVASIFVNPTQFGPKEDFEKYPRDLDADLAMLDEVGIDMVFAPKREEIYRAENSTYVDPPKVGELLEGQLRPGHFRGVATIVLKLFNIIPAHVAFFGQKDYQQTRVITDMAKDLNLPVSVQVCPVIRERDGLALSSRNVYLSPSERQQALSLSQALRMAVEMFRSGVLDPAQIREAMLGHIRQAGIESIDYVAIADPTTLQPVDRVQAGTMVLIACHVGQTRLIDNVRVG